MYTYVCVHVCKCIQTRYVYTNNTTHKHINNFSVVLECVQQPAPTNSIFVTNYVCIRTTHTHVSIISLWCFSICSNQHPRTPYLSRTTFVYVRHTRMYQSFLAPHTASSQTLSLFLSPSPHSLTHTNTYTNTHILMTHSPSLSSPPLCLCHSLSPSLSLFLALFFPFSLFLLLSVSFSIYIYIYTAPLFANEYNFLSMAFTIFTALAIFAPLPLATVPRYATVSCSVLQCTAVYCSVMYRNVCASAAR